jgi:SAM-dependent methyltransferase
VYTRSSEWYDLLHERKDYAAEVQRVVEVIRQYRPRAGELLDVACGTGGHLQHFCDQFTCHGVDLDNGLLEVARRRIPNIPFTHADMTDFDLGRRFDAVTCLFSAIGWVRTADRMRAAVQAMAGHLYPGGVLIIEPWILPEAWEAWVKDTDNIYVAKRDGLTVVRVRTTQRFGPMTELHLHYLAATNNEITTADECHQVGMFTIDELMDAATEAGLSATWDPDGITGRGLLVAQRSDS